jgi:ubiquinone/menaquinone biosynthesis C-methylase UbiE
MGEIDDVDMWNAAAPGFEAGVTDGSDWRQQHVIHPAVLSLLGQVEDQHILDAGCGPGWLSVKLAERGARVIGLDAAEQMVLRARERAADAPQNIQFVQADLCSPLPLEDSSFDGVVCNMVLMDIRKIHTAVAEFRRVLRLSGRLVLSITHPAFFPQLWEKDGDGRPLRKEPVEDYLNVRSEIINMCGGPTRHYHTTSPS